MCGFGQDPSKMYNIPVGYAKIKNKTNDKRRKRVSGIYCPCVGGRGGGLLYRTSIPGVSMHRKPSYGAGASWRQPFLWVEPEPKFAMGPASPLFKNINFLFISLYWKMDMSRLYKKWKIVIFTIGARAPRTGAGPDLERTENRMAPHHRYHDVMKLKKF